MRPWLLLATLVLCPGCTIGNGKFPNPQWKPTVHTVEIEPRPSTFVEGELRFSVSTIDEVEYTKYGPFRNATECGLYYDFVLRVGKADGTPGVDRNLVTATPMRVLDDQGEALRTAHGANVRVDHAESTPTVLVAHVRIAFVDDLPEREPTTLAIGDRRLPLE